MKNMQKNMIEKEKKMAGEKAAQIVKKMAARVKRPLKIGLGTGSTTKYFVEALGRLVKSGLKVKTVSTSEGTTKLARKLKIPFLGKDYNSIPGHELDVYVDGADDVHEKSFVMIKGAGGGAFTREEMAASMAKKIIIIVDSSKMVAKLGKSPVTLEAMRQNYLCIADILKKKYKCKVELKKETGDEIFVTDNGNYILNAYMPSIKDPDALKIDLKMLAGVVNVGLFTGKIRPDILIIGDKVIRTGKK